MNRLFIATISVIALLVAEKYTQHSCDKQETSVISKELKEIYIINSILEEQIDSLIYLYKKCKIYNENQPWEIYIQKTEVDHKKVWSIAISRSYYTDAPNDGYGYLSRHGILFIIQGDLLPKIFHLGSKSMMVKVHLNTPKMIFDPPRALFYYDNKYFYKADFNPCGG